MNLLLRIRSTTCCKFLTTHAWVALVPEIPALPQAGNVLSSPAQSVMGNAELAKTIAQVEAGLRPVSVIFGKPRWSLEERLVHSGVPGVGAAVIHNGELV